MTVQDVITAVQAITGDSGGSRWDADTVLVPLVAHVEGVLLAAPVGTRAMLDTDGLLKTRQTISATTSTMTVSSDFKEHIVQGVLWLCYTRESGDAEDRARAKEHRDMFLLMIGGLAGTR